MEQIDDPAYLMATSRQFRQSCPLKLDRHPLKSKKRKSSKCRTKETLLTEILFREFPWMVQIRFLFLLFLVLKARHREVSQQGQPVHEFRGPDAPAVRDVTAFVWPTLPEGSCRRSA